MGQVHRRFSTEQVRVLFQSYCERKITRNDLQQLLGIEKTRLFALLSPIAKTHTPSPPLTSDNHPAGCRPGLDSFMWRCSLMPSAAAWSCGP